MRMATIEKRFNEIHDFKGDDKKKKRLISKFVDDIAMDIINIDQKHASAVSARNKYLDGMETILTKFVQEHYPDKA